jgi:hypothetical protein
MSKLRQAAEQGLEALSLAFENDLTYLSDNAMIARQDVVRGRLAVNALRAALETPEQQPLPDEEIEQCCYEADSTANDHTNTWKWTKEFARAIERAHGIGAANGTNQENVR